MADKMETQTAPDTQEKAEKKKIIQIPKRPESLLKKRKTMEKIKNARRIAKLNARKKQKASRKIIFKRAENYVKEYRKCEKDEIRLKRLSKMQGDYYVPEEPKLAFVIRIRGINGVSPRVRKILQLLR